MNNSVLRSVAATLFALAGWAPPASPQTLPTFEAASIKPTDPEAGKLGRIQFLPGGRFSATNLPLVILIAAAWKLPYQGPRFTYTPDVMRLRYDIQATAPADAFPTGVSLQTRDDKMRLMLQALLTDRFRIRMAHETKVVPVYALTVAKGGPRLAKAVIEEKDCSVRTMPHGGPPPDPSIDGGIVCHRVWGGADPGLHAAVIDMSDLALFLDGIDDRAVIDRTGLKGLFSISTERYQQNAASANAEAGLPTLDDVLARMGLELKRDTAPVEAYRIEHIEMPTVN